MTPPLVPWHITPDATNEEAYAILSQDPVWNCFALADLESPLRHYSQFAIADQLTCSNVSLDGGSEVYIDDPFLHLL